MNNTRKTTDKPHQNFRKELTSFGQIQKAVSKNETAFCFLSEVKIISPMQAVKLAKDLIIDPNKEHFIAIYLTPIRKKPKCELISLGTLNASLVHLREVFHPAIKYCSTEIIILHNHPSGSVIPSEADIKLTERLKNAGQLLGINVLDHLIFEKGGEFWSFTENE